MQTVEVIKLASEIVKLDELRDEMWEKLLQHAGERALEVLRHVQNAK
ncbi:hypothetical protein [Sutcliffiella halmapala]|nr:hypothetical protein [Sutcliffiella halmapala]